jgi:YD repeat-containing protein
MRVSYDPEVDALSIIFRETTVTTKPLGEGIAVEYDQEGRLAGIEVLDAIKRFGDADSLRQVVIEGIGLTASSRHDRMVVAEKHGSYRTRKTIRRKGA